MLMNKSYLVAVLTTALLAGCSTVEQTATTDHIETTTSIDGVKVTSVAYKCRIEQSESEHQGQFEKQFLIEYSGQEQAMLVEHSGSYSLTRVRAASGSKYASVDGQQTFWEKGDKATITLNNETFKDCSQVKE